jgi:hypothetical protein
MQDAGAAAIELNIYYLEHRLKQGHRTDNI